MRASAVFLDRDGTIIEDSGYIPDPDQVKLLPGAAEAIRRMSEAGYLVVIASNQSGVARGLFDEAALSRVHARLERLLRDGGAGLDGAYYCPYLDGHEAKVEAYRRDSELRKPKPGMLLQAARELNLDLSRSWMIGDSGSDVEAGRRAGCRTIRIVRDGPVHDDEPVSPTHQVGTLQEAAEIVVNAASRPRNDTTRGAAAGPDADHAPRVDHDAQQEILRSLHRISDHMERVLRQQRQQDFSLLRLFGALSQMLAIVVALWGAAALFADQAPSATARFTFAGFLQLLSLSVWVADRFR